MDSPELVATVVANAKVLVAAKYDWTGIAQMQKTLLTEVSEPSGKLS